MVPQSYVIVTAARNEGARIEATIRSVVGQTVRPQKWVIVSDGSTDDTDAIVERHAQQHGFIELMRARPDVGRSFGSKAKAVNAGYASIGCAHDAVAVLDADVFFDATYFENVLKRLGEDERLGLTGGVVWEPCDGGYVPQTTSVEWSVAGGSQIFRRESWLSIGGYLPVRGGVDAVAEVMVRMKGWSVRAFPDLRVYHLRKTSSEKHGALGTPWHRGMEDYGLGYHPLFFVARCLRRVTDRPWLLASVLMFGGYAWAWVRRPQRVVPAEFVRYLRQEQWGRLRMPFARKCKRPA